MLRIGALLIATTVLAAGAAEAADFTFTVPVNARNLLPEVTRVGVTCKVYRGQNTVAEADSRVTPQNGTVQQTLTVEINVPAGQDKTTVDRYTCFFYVGTAGSVAMPRSCQYDWCRAKSGTVTSDLQTGSISN